MLEQGFGQLRELRASVAAAHAKVTTEVALKICSRTRFATKAFTSLRSQANAHTDANMRSVVLTFVLRTTQAADAQRRALLEGPLAQAAVDRTVECMHTFHTCQFAIQATEHAHVCVKKAIALQMCLNDHYRIMKAKTGVSSCWEQALQQSRRMLAARATALSSQKLVQTHAACTRAVNNKAAAVVESSASDSLQWHSSDMAALPPLDSHAPQAYQMASAANDIQGSSPTGPVRSEREKRTSTLVTSRYRQKRPSQPLASTSNSQNGEQLASVQQRNEVRPFIQSLYPQRPRSPSGGPQRSKVNCHGPKGTTGEKKKRSSTNSQEKPTPNRPTGRAPQHPARRSAGFAYIKPCRAEAHS
jgi:hypothetical protein